MANCPFIRQPDPARFRVGLQHLQRRFIVYSATSPQPLPAPGLIVTPEIRLQSELYLPLKELRSLFNRLYQQVLPYPPILSSTPFQTSLSWADCYAGLPGWLQRFSNPAVLLEQLLADHDLLTRFVFHSFLPSRFNGAGFGRYPAQRDWLRQQLPTLPLSLRILDAACGSGEGTWELAELLSRYGRQPEQIQLEGWTLEPLEVWTAQHQALPHEPQREQSYQQRVQPLRQQGWGERVRFQAVDLLEALPDTPPFDLILCNGLLGGPIISSSDAVRQVLGQLAALLKRGGMLLVADHFHDGWKKKLPLGQLRELVQYVGLKVQQTGEELVGIKPYT